LPKEDHQCAGIYVVYRGLNEDDIKKLLYIGRSGDVADRPSPTHHKYNYWLSYLEEDEILYFSFADTDDEKQAEAALIFHHKPPCNDKGKKSFNHPHTRIITLGKNKFLADDFTEYNEDDLLNHLF